MWNAAQGLVAMGVHMAVEVVGNHYLKKQPWQHATSRNKNQTGRIRRGIESWYSRLCKTAKWTLKKIQDSETKNHPKTRLWNLSQMLSWFQDRANFSKTHVFWETTLYHPLELLRGVLFIDLHITIASWLVANTVFIRLTAVGAYYIFGPWE